MVFAKLLGVIVRLLISTDGLHSSSWVMPKKVFMTIATGTFHDAFKGLGMWKASS